MSVNMKLGERRAWRLFLASASTVAGSCLAYKLFTSNYVAEKRHKLDAFLRSLSALSAALSSTSDISATICRDLQQFLHSNNDEVPRSVRQLLKLSCCVEFRGAVSDFSEGIMSGVVRGISATASDLQASVVFRAGAETVPAGERLESATEIRQNAPGNTGGLPERILDKLFSDAGRGFVSVVIGRAVRSLVQSYFDCASRRARRLPREAEHLQVGVQQAGILNAAESSRGWDQILLELAETPNGKALVTLIVSCFASNVVNTFLESTDGVNVCEELVSSMTKAPFKEPVTDLLRNVASGAVESLVRTSHEVFSAERGGQSSTARDMDPEDTTSSIQPRDLFPSTDQGNPETFPNDSSGEQMSGTSQESQSLDRSGPSASLQGRDWQWEVQKLLAAPETRQLVVDVAGTMSVQGIRTFGSLFMETFSQYSGASGSTGRPSFSLRGVASKAMTASSVCLALCLHMIISPRVGNL